MFLSFFFGNLKLDFELKFRCLLFKSLCVGGGGGGGQTGSIDDNLCLYAAD